MDFMRTESVLMNCKPNIKILHYTSMSQILLRHKLIIITRDSKLQG